MKPPVFEFTFADGHKDYDFGNPDLISTYEDQLLQHQRFMGAVSSRIVDLKLKPVCSTCGSSDVTNDAIASFNVVKQKWEISSLLDNADCNDCGGETSIIMVPL